MSTEMLLGEIKARLDSLSQQLKNLEDHVGKGIEKLEDRVSELEKDQHRLKGMLAAGLFVGTVVMPILIKKLGL